MPRTNKIDQINQPKFSTIVYKCNTIESIILTYTHLTILKNELCADAGEIKLAWKKVEKNVYDHFCYDNLSVVTNIHDK